MTSASVDDRMTESPEETVEAGMAAKLLGTLIAIGLTAAGLAGLVGVQALLERRDTAILRTIPDVLVTWREPAPGQFWIFLLIMLPPMLLIPGAFGVRGQSLTPVLPPAWRWRMVAIAAAFVAAGVGLEAAVNKPELVVATPFGAAWLRDGKPREHWSWGAATSVGVACAKTSPDDAREGQPALNYDVAFPSGREASLIRDTKHLGPLLARLTPIDQSLRARAVPRFASVDAACLDHFDRGLAPAQRAALRTLLSR
ncbi:hypothetical protein [Caulobacter sp. 1776]|uniref:hypothetical protein n=1 Tax=Caulobacter sp. 1776 TaxID=3156420 RepID=UPI0033930837